MKKSFILFLLASIGLLSSCNVDPHSSKITYLLKNYSVDTVKVSFFIEAERNYYEHVDIREEIFVAPDSLEYLLSPTAGYIGYSSPSKTFSEIKVTDMKDSILYHEKPVVDSLWLCEDEVVDYGYIVTNKIWTLVIQ